MTLRIVEVDARGLKAKDASLHLEPVHLITGPNGSGKSAVLEAISYALTGHVAGVKATEMGLLLPDPKTVSVVVNAADANADRTVSISRGIQSGKKYARGRAFSRQTGDSKEAKTAGEISSFVNDWYGPHAELFLEAFDPEKNIWSLSAEARLRWTFGVVARASGWTKTELGVVLSKLGHGNIDFGNDVVECLDLNIRAAAEWMRSTAKAVREYDAILAGLTDSISDPKPEEIAAAQKEVKERRDRFSNVQMLLRKASLQKEIAHAESILVTQRQAAADLETLRDARRDVVLAENAELERIQSITLEKRMLENYMAVTSSAITAIEANGACPTCGAAYVDEGRRALIYKWLAEQTKRQDSITVAETVIGVWVDGAGARSKAEKDYKDAEQRLMKLGALDVQRTEEKIRVWEQSIDDLNERLGTQVSGADASAIQAELEAAEAKLEEMRGREQVSKERAKKTAERDKANVAAAERLKKHEELCDVRAKILADARRAVSGAIEDLDHSVAPHGSKWTLNIADETGLDIAYQTKDGSFVRFKGMSSGEKIVATVVLLAALRRLIGETPWSALLVDNLELTSYAERLRLVGYVSALSGLFSNVILLSSDNRPVGNVATTSFE